MIIVKAINGSPEYIPKTTHGVHCDGVNFYYFETQQEFDEFIAALPVAWDKKAYEDVINAAHSDWYRSIYTRKPDLDYSGIGEIGLYLNHPDFGAQAQALQQLWWHSVEILYAHLEEVTEQTALSVEHFIATLPQFNL